MTLDAILAFTWDQVDLSQIDVVLLSTEPFSFQQSHALELQTQIGKPVLVVDGEMLSWYGSRVIQGVEYLRTLKIQKRPQSFGLRSFSRAVTRCILYHQFD